MNYKLSIYIPTYNRQDTLVELLNSIGSIRQTTSNKFEVVVSDNASTDGTINLVVKASELGIVDKYIRNAKNVGADRNILDCFNRTSGDYVWILCDDDLPNLGAVDNIHHVIDKFSNESPSLIYLNCSQELLTGQILMQRMTECEEGLVRDLESLLLNPGLDLLRASTLVLRRQMVPGNYVQLFGVGGLVSPLALAFDALVRGGVYLFSAPQTRYREGDKSGWSAEWPNILHIRVPALIRQLCIDHHIDPTEILKNL